MGNITQYDAGNLGLQPSETGVEAAAGAGRRIGAFSNQAAEDLKSVGQEFASAIRTTGGTVNQVLENREINTGGMHAATFTLNHNQAWHDYITGADIPDDPDNPNARQDAITARINNPGAASQWIENTLDPDLDKFKDGFLTEGGQKWAQGWVDRYRQHAVTTAIADQSSMAGAVVQANIEKAGNTLAADTFSHPANLGINFDLLDHTIKGNVNSSPTITPDVATKILQEHSTAEKEKLVQSAIQGAITKGGDWRSIASDPKYAPYVKPGENERFERQEKQYQTSMRVASNQERIQQTQIAEQAAHTAINDSWARNVSVDQNSGKVTINPQFISDMAKIPFEHRNAPDAVGRAETQIKWAQAEQSKPPVSDDPAVKSALLDGMFSADKPTTTLDVQKARADEKITEQTFTALHGLAEEIAQGPLKDPVWKDTIDAVKGDLILSNVGLPGKDITGEGNYAKWAQNFIPQYLSQKRAGTLPPNALDVKDPTSLISQSMAPFRRSVTQRITDYLSVLGLDEKGVPRSTPTVTTKDQFDALKSGDTYVGADGKTYRKP